MMNTTLPEKPSPARPPAEARRNLSPAGEPPPSMPAVGPWRQVRARRALVLTLALSVALATGFLPRWHARRVLAAETRELSVPTVTVVSPAPGRVPLALSLPAELKPYVEASINARANGYLKRWLVDLGDEVKEGQWLAEIDTPELDQDLARARAEAAQAEAALELARTTAARWKELLKTASVSEQETAEKSADFTLRSATLAAARANVRRLEELKSFAHIVAPFAGTVTARNTDVGQLITSGGTNELFRLAQTRTLRVRVRVPQTLAHLVKPGQPAELTLAELPGRRLEARVVRTAGAMEPDSRTLLTELEVDNSSGEILAGSYAQVRFVGTGPDATLTLPSNTLLFRAEGMQVGLVTPDQKVELRQVKIGRDFGQVVEVLEGVSPTDRVILNPPDSLAAGTPVRLARTPDALAAQ